MDSTNKSSNDPWIYVTPGQKLYILTTQLKGLIEIIRVYATLIKQNIESDNIKPEALLKEITTIAEVADKIRDLPDEVIQSKSSFSDVARKSTKISSLDIFLYLRERLLGARAQNDAKLLTEIQTVCDLLLDFAYLKGVQGVGIILEEFESSARDSLMGVPWKSTIPSEEEIRLVLGNEEPH